MTGKAIRKIEVIQASKLVIALIAALVISACSTRGPIDNYDGSTAQRLVTYSIDSLMKQLPEGDFSQLSGKVIYLRTHFIASGEVLDYATQRLRFELQNRFSITFADNKASADTLLDVFFTSLGTDKDTFGLSIPVFWVTAEEATRLDLLAVKMFHGVSELYYYTTDLSSGEVSQSSRLLSRSRADTFATPIISFPVDDLDEASVINK